MSTDPRPSWNPASSAPNGPGCHVPGQDNRAEDEVLALGPDLDSGSGALDWALLRELQGAISHPSVSILLGTNPGAQMTSLDVSRLHHLATRARLRLQREVRGDQLSSLEERLARAVDLAQSSASHEGLAVLASARHMMVVRLPFEPRDRAVVDPTFATRDLLVAVQCFPRYRLLALGSDHPRILEGRARHLVEVTATATDPDQTGSFPRALPGPGGARRYPERWIPDLARRRAALNAAEHDLDQRVAHAGHLPLVVVASPRLLVEFAASSRHARSLVGQVRGNHRQASAGDLGDLVQPALAAWRADQVRNQLRSLETADRTGSVVWGLHQSWEAANEGRAQHLWVDQQYAVPARLSDAGKVLHVIADPETVNANDDVVDELIEMVAAMRRPVDIVPWLSAAYPAGVAVELVGAFSDNNRHKLQEGREQAQLGHASGRPA